MELNFGFGVSEILQAALLVLLISVFLYKYIILVFCCQAH